MNNKLPKVFANKIDKELKNNEKIYASNSDKKEINTEFKGKKEKKTTREKNDKTINQKIDEIIKTKQYIYRIPVKIKLKDKEIITNIIGKNKTNIITLNNELIKIEEIEDIEINKKNE